MRSQERTDKDRLARKRKVVKKSEEGRRKIQAETRDHEHEGTGRFRDRLV